MKPTVIDAGTLDVAAGGAVDGKGAVKAGVESGVAVVGTVAAAAIDVEGAVVGVGAAAGGHSDCVAPPPSEKSDPGKKQPKRSWSA